jgi:hypothetical protein
VNERIEKLEAELAAMRPRKTPADLIARIEAGLSKEKSTSWSDRFLILSMSGGAVAACVIVAILLMQSPGQIRTVDSPVASMETPTVGGFPQAFAWADRRIDVEN